MKQIHVKELIFKKRYCESEPRMSNTEERVQLIRSEVYNNLHHYAVF